MSFRTTRDARSRTYLGLEALDIRAVPATFAVDNTIDLQADVEKLSSSPVPNTIVVDQGIYDLTTPLQIQNPNNLTIVGRYGQYGRVNLIAPVGNRAFDINGGNVTLEGLTIAGGGDVGQGGGILSQNATLTLKSDTVTGNTAGVSGGGIFVNGGTLDALNSTIISNGIIDQTGGGGAGIGALNANVILNHTGVAKNAVDGISLSTPMTVTATGGGIDTQGGTLSMIYSSVSHNNVYTATSGTSATSSGAGITSTDTAVTINSSLVEGNGLVALSAGTNSLRGSAFTSNGGSLTIDNTTVAGNAPVIATVFDYTGTTVVLHNTTLDNQQVIHNRTLPPQTD